MLNSSNIHGKVPSTSQSFAGEIGVVGSGVKKNLFLLSWDLNEFEDLRSVHLLSNSVPKFQF